MTTVSVLVIPGVKGFQLMDQHDGAILWQLEQQAHDRLQDLTLQWDEGGEQCSASGSSSVVPGELESRLYGFVRRRLERADAPPLVSVEYFRYDWRLPSLANRHLLATELSSRPPRSTLLIAHSLGSLLTCALLALPDAPLSSLAGILFVSPPFAGVPSALEVLLNGDGDVPDEWREEYRRVALSFPSLYELLPVYPTAISCDDEPFSLLQPQAASYEQAATAVRANLDYLLRFRREVSSNNGVLRNNLNAINDRCLVVGSSGVVTPAMVELKRCSEQGPDCFPFCICPEVDHALRLTTTGDGRVPLRSFSRLAELFPTVIIGSAEEPLSHTRIMGDSRFLDTISNFIATRPDAPETTDWWLNPGEQVRHFPPGVPITT